MSQVWVLSVAVAADGARAVSGGADGTVRVWDLSTGQEQASLTGHTGWVNAVAVAVAADGARAVSGGADGTVRVWDLSTGQEQASLTGHTGSVYAVAVAADGARAVSGGADGTVRVWDLSTGQEQASLTGHTGSVYAVAVAADGARAVSGGGDGTVRVWDLSTGQEQASLTGHTGSVYAVAVAADGARAVSGGADGTVRVWDLSTGQEQASLTGHTGSVYAVAVAADGPRAVSGGADGTVRVWDLSTGHEQASLTGHTGWVNAVAVAADGTTAVSGDQRTVQIHDLSTAHKQSMPVDRTERSHRQSGIRIGRESGESLPRRSYVAPRFMPPPRPRPSIPRAAHEATTGRSAEDPEIDLNFSQIGGRRAQAADIVIGRMAAPDSVSGLSYAGRSGPAVPLGERTDPLPHDGLFIRRNNAFGTKSTIGITDLIEQGMLIDQERIRFDDFVAARSDEVPQPSAGEAVGVSCGLARTVPDCRASQQATHFLEIALRAADSAGASTTPPAPLPVNFVFVVDTSGSMSGVQAGELLKGPSAGSMTS